MMDNSTEEQVINIAKSIIKQEDIFLLDVEIKNANLLEVWILLDSEQGGVNVDTCSKISRELANIFEEQNIFSSAYRLNVSSPGLSRPLSDIRQYPKNKGRTVKVKFKTEEGYEKIEGILDDVNDEHLVVKTDGHRKEIDFNNVVETKIIPKI